MFSTHHYWRIYSLVLFAILTLLLSPSQLFAQLFEDFERGSKGSYAAAVVEFESGEWLLDDALIGRSSGDRFFDTQSIRLRDGFIEMQFNSPDGAEFFSFYGANAGFSNDTGGSVQVSYSKDNGSTWETAGEVIPLTESNVLEYYEVSVDESGPIRFRIDRIDGNRVNIDNVQISPFQQPTESPKLIIRSDGEEIADSDTLVIPASNINSSEKITFNLSNRGLADLEIFSAEWANGAHFELQDSVTGIYEGETSRAIEVSFTANESGIYSDSLSLESNDPDQPTVTIIFKSLAIDETDLMSIRDVKALPFGIRVKVGGIVTVSDQFNGPSFIQDQTAGIAISNTAFQNSVSIGDSVSVTGPISEFNPANGMEGRYLTQIGPYDGDQQVNFEIVEQGVRAPEPLSITIDRMRNGKTEGKLIVINNVIVKADGDYSSGSVYEISDRSGAGRLVISDNSSEFEQLSISQGPVHISGVVDRFDGIYRIKPRTISDIQDFEKDFTGEDIPLNETFDVVTWNIEWFGSTFNGPPDPIAQMNNVIQVIETIDADLYALQEIANPDRFYALVDSLESYRGFLAPYGQTQKTAYLFKPSVVDSISSGLLEQGQNSFDWAGRLPLMFTFNVTIAEESRRVHSYNIHAKAFGDEPSYERRKSAAMSIWEYFNNSRNTDNVLFFGDFNDQLNYSTFNEEESPYSIFLEDENYLAVTKVLEDEGFSSYKSAQFRSFIDHIIVKNKLIEYHIDGSQRVVDVSFINNFESTTSDHAPVWSRYQFTEGGVGPPPILPEQFTVEPNFPNPFNPSTTISFNLPEQQLVSIKVYDILGRRVATVLDGVSYQPGTHFVPFDAGDLSSGIYFYRVTLNSGESITEQMMYIK